MWLTRVDNKGRNHRDYNSFITSNKSWFSDKNDLLGTQSSLFLFRILSS